jgi:hypothetical protein
MRDGQHWQLLRKGQTETPTESPLQREMGRLPAIVVGICAILFLVVLGIVAWGAVAGKILPFPGETWWPGRWAILERDTRGYDAAMIAWSILLVFSGYMTLKFWRIFHRYCIQLYGPAERGETGS